MRFHIPLAALLIAAASCGPAPARLPVSPGPAGSAPRTGGSVTPPTKTVGMALLGGRLRAIVPGGSALAPRRQNIMAAEESSSEESRVVLVPGTEDTARFVLLAREGFEFGSGDPVKDAQVLVREDREERYLIQPLEVGAGLKAASFIPQKRVRGKGPLLVLGALLEQPDHTIQTVLFFILPEMESERATWEAKARSIAAALSAGGKTLELPAGEKRLDAGAGSDLVLQMPRGYVLSVQKGPDFSVYHARKLTRVGAPPALLGIYVGGHPSYQYKQNQRGEEGVTRSKLTIGPLRQNSLELKL